MRTGILVSILVLTCTSLFAQNRGTGFDMLNNSPSPFSLSRAEATVSAPEGSASIFSNPALLVSNHSSSIDLGYSFWIMNTKRIFGGVNLLKNRQAISFSFYSSGSDDYRQSDGPGDSNGTFSIQYLSVAAAYAYDFKYFSLGAAFQYLNEQNYTFQASGYAFNAGIAGQYLNDRLRVGASVSNIGEMQKLEVDATNLPLNAKIGASADLFEISTENSNELSMLISAYADYVYPLNAGESYDDYIASEPYFNTGLAITVAEAVEISGGYKTGNDIRPFSFGAAFMIDPVTFHYALVPFKSYGTVHSIGIQYNF